MGCLALLHLVLMVALLGFKPWCPDVAFWWESVLAEDMDTEDMPVGGAQIVACRCQNSHAKLSLMRYVVE